MKQFSYPDADLIGEGEIRAFKVEERSLLLIRHQGSLYCIDNRCGHFGAPLATGSVVDGAIRCSLHQIAFSLNSGEVVTETNNQCSAIAVYPVEEREGEAVIDLAPGFS